MDPAQLEQLKAQSGAAEGGPGGAPGAGGGPSEGDMKAKREKEEDMKRDMLSQLLLPEARERLSRIQLVRPQRAEQITGLLARMAQAGQLRGRVTEEQLVDVLNQVEAMEEGRAPGTQGGGQGSKIVFSRRKGDYSDDEDDWMPSGSTAAAKQNNNDSDDDEFDL